jgi:hypothetical protein
MTKILFPGEKVGLISRVCLNHQGVPDCTLVELILHTGQPLSRIRKMKPDDIDTERGSMILATYPDPWLLPLSTHVVDTLQLRFLSKPSLPWHHGTLNIQNIESYFRTVTEIEEFELATLPRVFELGMQHLGTPNKLIAAATNSPNRRGYRIPSQEELEELRDYMNRWSSLILELGENAILPERDCLKFD